MNLLWALIALVGLGLFAMAVHIVQGYIRSRRIAKGLEVEDDEPAPLPTEGGCCGMHMTCERDSLLAAVSPKIVYYDDEELDRYQGTSASSYGSEAVEEFRDVLITLQEDEVAGWIRSLQHRNIELPEELLPEVFLIVGETRAYHIEHGPGDRH